MEARFRHLTSLGAYQIGGFLTYGKIDNIDEVNADRQPGQPARDSRLCRGQWPLPVQPRMEPDRVAPAGHRQDRHAALRPDPRRPAAQLRRGRADHPRQLSVDRRLGVRGPARRRRPEAVPIALPAIDARLRLDDPWLGGKVELQGNSLAILRIDGQDTQRAFASARWDLRRLTRGGQELTLTAFARGDVYHSNDAGRDRHRFLPRRRRLAGARASARSPPTCATR